jgi:hypothetical protein
MLKNKLLPITRYIKYLLTMGHKSVTVSHSGYYMGILGVTRHK